MLRKDQSARFERRGLFGSRFAFAFGRKVSEAISRASYEAILDAQTRAPVLIAEDWDSGRQYWLFEDQFYWCDEGLSSHEIHALLHDRARKSRSRAELAVASMDGTATGREHIPAAVRTFVWNRDGGKCVRCGSQQRLEFDHIIPLSRGGSNSERNLQLLCQNCNRAKATSIG